MSRRSSRIALRQNPEAPLSRGSYTATTPLPTKTFPLLSLPFDVLVLVLREFLYGRTFTLQTCILRWPSGAITSQSAKLTTTAGEALKPDLLRVCKILRDFGSYILYSLNQINLAIPCDGLWLENIGQLNVANLRQLHLDLLTTSRSTEDYTSGLWWLRGLSMLSVHNSGLLNLTLAFSAPVSSCINDFVAHVTLLDAVTDLKNIKSLKSIIVTNYGHFLNYKIWLRFLNRKMGIPITLEASYLYDENSDDIQRNIANMLGLFETWSKSFLIQFPGIDLSRDQFLASASLFEGPSNAESKLGNDMVFDYKTRHPSFIPKAQHRTFAQRSRMLWLANTDPSRFIVERDWKFEREKLEYLLSFWREMQDLGIYVRKTVIPVTSAGSLERTDSGMTDFEDSEDETSDSDDSGVEMDLAEEEVMDSDDSDVEYLGETRVSRVLSGETDPEIMDIDDSSDVEFLEDIPDPRGLSGKQDR